MRKIKRFECHYHGAPVIINTKFDMADLHAEVLYDDGEWKDLRPEDLTILEDRTVLEKENTFTASYMDMKCIFHVKGASLNITDTEFRIFAVESKSEVDVTYAYENILYNEVLGRIYITLDILNRVLVPGKYRIIAPRNTGLCCKYASEWIVIKDINNNIRTTPVKYYTQQPEEQQPWQQN